MPKSFEDIAQTFKEIEQARAYISITQEMGPSEQLLAFINYDNSLATGLGLESFDGFDLEAQHDILLANLDPDGLEQIALEGFGDALKKYRRGLLLGGLLIPIFFPFGVAGYILKGGENRAKTVSYRDFKSARDLFEHSLSSDSELAANIPTVFTVEAWEGFVSNGGAHLDNHHDEFESKGEVAFAQSGWTTSNFENAIDWLKLAAGRFKQMNIRMGTKLASVEHFVDGPDSPTKRKVLPYISKSIGLTSTAGKQSEAALAQVNSIVRTAAKNFEGKHQ